MSDLSDEGLAARIQRLEDIHEIQTVKYRYFRCIDTAAHDELRTLFHPDVTTDLAGAGYQINLRGADAYVNFIRDMIHAGIVAQHQGHHPEIALVSDTEATGRWYLHDIFIDLAAGTRMSGTAFYDDRYVKHEGRWVILHSAYRRVYELSEKLDGPPNLTAHLLAERGHRHPEGYVPKLEGQF